MWEYNRIEIKFQLFKELTDELNALGKDGWDVIYYNETKPAKFGDDWICVVLIKRKKPNGNQNN